MHTRSNVDGREQNVLNMRDIDTSLCPGLPDRGGWGGGSVWECQCGFRITSEPIINGH